MHVLMTGKANSADLNVMDNLLSREYLATLVELAV